MRELPHERGSGLWLRRYDETMSRVRILLASILALWLAAAQAPAPFPMPPAPGEEPEKRLPDGRSLDNERAKLAYQSSLEDAQKLVKDAEDLKSVV